MFENVDGRTPDGGTTDAGVTGILIAHLGAFGSGELKSLIRFPYQNLQFCLCSFLPVTYLRFCLCSFLPVT